MRPQYRIRVALNRRRLSLHLSYADIARMLGISPTAARQIFTNLYQDITITALARVASALDWTISDAVLAADKEVH